LSIVALAFNLIYPFRMQPPAISLASEQVTHIGALRITNTLLATWLGMLFLVAVSWLATRRMQTVPRGLQNLVEWVIESLTHLVETVAGSHTPRIFPAAATLFLLIAACNWMGLLPGFLSIYIQEGEEHIPLLRSAATDLNLTLALAISSVALCQVFGIQASGVRGYLSRFANVRRFKAFWKGITGRGPHQGVGSVFYGLIDLFVGALELVGELTHILSFSFRLFGNVFAGEVLLGVMMFLVPCVAALPFLGLEVFVGLIQALVFAILSTAFFVQAMAHHDAETPAHDESLQPAPSEVTPAVCERA